jgi:hypothetical protein
MREKPEFPADSRVFWEARQNAGMLGWCGRIRTAIWQVGNQTLSRVRESQQNHFPVKFISNSKRSNFENRTELMESRASERNGPFREK